MTKKHSFQGTTPINAFINIYKSSKSFRNRLIKYSNNILNLMYSLTFPAIDLHSFKQAWKGIRQGKIYNPQYKLL